MRVLRSGDDLSDLKSESIFLAGPSPRRKEVESWRPGAIEAIKQFGFAGDVLVPEPFIGNYDLQITWEDTGLEQCGRICFWVPRHLATLPGFTTNVEFGRYVTSGRILYGRPPGAPHTGYLDWHYLRQVGQPPFDELRDLLQAAVAAL